MARAVLVADRFFEQSTESGKEIFSESIAVYLNF